MRIIRFCRLVFSLGIILFPLHVLAADSSPSPIELTAPLSSKPLTEKAHKLTSQAVMSISMQGDYDSAIRFYEAALKEMPGDRGILIALSHVKYQKEKSLGLIKPQPGSKAAILLDALQSGRGDWQASIRYLEDAMLDEQNKDRLLATRDALVELKGIYEDEQFLHDAQDLMYGYSREDATVKLLQGAFNNLEKGYFDEAMEDFKGALKLNPGDARIREMIAYVGGLQFSRYENLSTWARNQKAFHENLKAEALQRENDALQALVQSQEALRISLEYDDAEAVSISELAIGIAQQALAKARAMVGWADMRLAATEKARTAATQGEAGVASQLKGDVRIKTEKGWKKFNANTALRPGDEIRTGKNGFAELVMTDGSIINIDADTSFRVGDPNRKMSLYEKIIGRIHTQVNCVQRSGRPCRQHCYRVSNVNICIRGTELEINARNDGPAMLTIMDGLVEIIPVNGGKRVEVNAGWQVEFTRDGTIESQSLFDLSELQRWWE